MNVLVLLVCALCFCVEGKVGVYKESTLLELTDSTFDGALKEHDDLLVKFYAPWCGHCKNLAPGWEEMAREMKGVTIAKLDATVQEKVAARFGVQSYPTIYYFKKGHFKVKFSGPLEKKTIAPWAKKVAKGKPVKRLNSADEVASFTAAPLAVVGLFSEGCVGREYRAFAGSAFEMNPRLNPEFSASFPFACVSGQVAQQLADQHGTTVPGVLLFRDFEFEDKVISLDDSFMKLTPWLEKNSVSAMIPASQENEEKFFSNIAPGSAILFVFTKEATDGGIRAEAHKVAAENRDNGKLKVVSGLDNDYGEAISEQNFNKKRGAFPFAGILQFGETEADDKYFEMGSDLSLDYAGLSLFLTQWKEGLLKSEGDPTVVLTSSNFQKEVIDNNQHVLVEFYAPWCGHCKALAPVWRIMALKYQKDKSIKIAKMDSTEHSHPSAKVEGYPTIMLYKKGKKNAPVKFDGNRQLDDFVKFLEKEAK
eukprot:TRINITY_DN67080_c5_g3_i1.p1 TRINITY_DN67080_c5_g3~~TRINITY_DN67080_c5_g3_i1.p1  ORF type:complete len:479 (-),score=91.67 TRINITY_DN67080_c5_g3_i1:1727-3163(-)